MRVLRLFLYFLFGLLLSSIAVLSHAESIAALTGGTYTKQFTAVSFFGWAPAATLSEACVSHSTAATVYSLEVISNTNHCKSTRVIDGYIGYNAATYQGMTCNAGDNATLYLLGTVTCNHLTPYCPSGQNWTLAGSSCTRPDCEGDQVRDSGGVCQCPAGKTLEEGTCKTTCPGGYHRFTPDDGRCEKDCIGNQVQDSSGVCKCTPSSNKVYALTAELGGSPGCDGGCKTTSFLGTLYCPKSAAPLASIGSLPAGMTCYGYGGRTGDTCTPATPPRIDVRLSPVPPPAPVPEPVQPTPENPTPPAPDPKTTPDNNKDPVACGAAGGVYLEVGGQGKCASPSPDNKMEGVKVKATETVTTNPDGSKTITTEKTTQTNDPVTGQTGTKKTTETVTKDASGNTTGTSTSDKTGTSDSGSGDGSGDEPGQCAKEPNSPMCKKGTVPQKGKFDDGQDGKVTAAKDQLRAKFAEVKSAASSMFSGSLATGGGSLPCPPPITILGKSWTLCFADYSDQLSIIGTFIMLAAAVGAAFIVLRR